MQNFTLAHNSCYLLCVSVEVAILGSCCRVSWTQMAMFWVGPSTQKVTVLVAEVWALQDLLSSQATASSGTVDTPKYARIVQCS